MPQYRQFFNNIAELRSNLRGLNTVLAKEIIGDSVTNNRTLTVNQTVRFLVTIGQITLARQLEAIKNVLNSTVVTQRSNRTDAIDLNELVSVYRIFVMNGRTHRQEIGRTLSKVG